MVGVSGDASTIILLAKTTLLRIVCENTGLSMTETAYSEATRKEERGDARMIINLQEEGKIKVVKDPKNTERLAEQFNMGKVEASAVALAGRENQVVLTDDKRSLKAARANNIGRATAASITASLVEEKIIGKEKALDALSILEKEGRYDPYIIDDVRRRIRGGEKE